MTFDYRVIKLNNKGPGSVEALLNEAARQGFRLVSVTGTKPTLAILERAHALEQPTATEQEEHARYFAERAGWGSSEPETSWHS